MSYPNQARDVPASSTDEDEGTVDTMEPRSPEDRAPDTEDTQLSTAESDEPSGLAAPEATEPEREPDGGGPTAGHTDDQARPVDAAWSTDSEHRADAEPAEVEPDRDADAEPSTEDERSTDVDRDVFAETSEPSAEDEPSADAEPPTEDEPSADAEPPTEAEPWAEAERPTDADTDVFAEPSEPSTVGEPSTATEESPFPAVEPAAGEALAEMAPAEEATELMPGAVSVEPTADLWPDDVVAGFRDRWRAVQLRFVDDPEGAADEAAALVGEAVDALTASLATQRGSLDDWRSASQASDTERLRVTVRGYREFLDRLLDL